ncbi:MAG: hypothetical protein JST00_33835 [Deltaproteobacteria bacterium]|nr:hypothetical protein [Deltaproteobacteria bacterium]
MRASRFVAGSFVLAGAFVGCAYDWSFPGDGANPPTLDAGNTPDTASDTRTETSTIDGGGSDVFTPGTCKDNTQCKSSEYCHFEDRACGLGALGKCTLPEGASCSIERPVCTCAGEQFASSCLATQKLQDPGVGPCPKSAGGYFLCGHLYCKPGSEFCLVSRTTGTTAYSCEGMVGCGPPAKCSCTEPDKLVTTSGCVCTDDGASGLTVDCKN